MPVRPAIALFAALALLPFAANAGDATPGCTYAEVAHFPLRYSGPQLEITFDGEIDGTPAPMLVDTGAFSSFMTATGVKRRKLPLRRTGELVTGVGGDARIFTTELRDLAVGPVHSGKAEMQVLTSMGGVPAYDAIIGVPFLMQADLEISLGDKMLKLYRASGCDDTFLALWPEGSIDVPLLRGYKGAVPQFNVQVNGVRMNAIIDTGASASSISLKAVRFTGVNPGTPGVKANAGAVGIGDRVAKTWSATFDTLSIGSETITKPELTIIERHPRPDIDVVLGADFLRAHRVLFAISQGKLYVAYTGGEVFPHRSDIEPWVEREAKAGNADAQYVLGLRTVGAGDKAKGMALVEQAAANGSPYASLLLAARMVQEDRYADAEPLFMTVVEKLPGERQAPLGLYLARLARGDGERGRRDLAAAFDAGDNEWPAPVAAFYLGQIDAGELLSKAAGPTGAVRTCHARLAIAALFRARGDKAQADAADLAAKAECPAPKPRQ